MNRKTLVALASTGFVVAMMVLGMSAAPMSGSNSNDWTSFLPVDRAHCLMMVGTSGAYTDLLACLRMKHSARLQMPPGTVGQGTSPE